MKHLAAYMLLVLGGKAAPSKSHSPSAQIAKRLSFASLTLFETCFGMQFQSCEVTGLLASDNYYIKMGC